MKSSGIGGQAVIEGVMMKNGREYAVAVRKPDGEIEIRKEEYEGITGKCALFRVPFIRGIFNFIESMSLGMKILNYSASFYEEEEKQSEEEAGRQKKKEEAVMAVTMVFSVVLAIGIFMLLPTFLAGLVRGWLFPAGYDNYFVIAAIEGVIRIAIFIAYVAGISVMEDIRRVFMYHGAEHKSINCIEHGLPLTVENVRKSSKEHKRCGTSFLLFVVVISTVVVMFVHTDTLWLRMLSRILLLPVITGLSYEFLKLAGRSDSPVINGLSRPGLWLQGLTTREPDDDMIRVAIASVEAVFDWRAYLQENFGLTVPEEEVKKPSRERAEEEENGEP
ncbi:MAG: DUF1385 domain-containing protein [Lachnospiraceae bacterium]|jgi:uncharacterized protein YqhQ|nr:DUF1385 domain-containing protein [Lachnospiraceae bacterium]